MGKKNIMFNKYVGWYGGVDMDKELAQIPTTVNGGGCNVPIFVNKTGAINHSSAMWGEAIGCQQGQVF